MPSNVVAHICLLVEDLDVAIADWTKLLKVLDPEQLEEPIVRYEQFEAGGDTMRWATFVSNSGPEIQLMEPGRSTPLGERLARHGEHVHHICFTSPDVGATMQRLLDEGVELNSTEVFTDPTMPWQSWSWVPPKATHGTLVEVARPYRAVSGAWESAADEHRAAPNSDHSHA